MSIVMVSVSVLPHHVTSTFGLTRNVLGKSSVISEWYLSIRLVQSNQRLRI